MIRALLIIIGLARAQCPSICHCSPGHLVECVNGQLENVPSIHAATAALDLTGNLFTTIDVAAYGQLERLVLDLNKNIEAQLGLALPKSLRELSLQNCRLNRLVKVTKGKGSIRRLNLANNRLKRIEEFEFAGWNELEELDLSGNEIVIKQSGNGNFFRDVPKSITKLILDNNRIQTLQWGSMAELKHLAYLSLRQNDIKQLPKLPSALSLRYIDLSQNRIDKIETFTFQNMPKLETLNLAQNDLKDGDSLLVGALYVENTALLNLNISHNRIERLEYSLLWQLEKLETLDVSHNQINSMDLAGTENTNHLGSVHLDSVWKDVGRLKYLDMSFNNLTRLYSNGFKPLVQLTQLRLESNNIGLLEERAFDGLNAIQQISLANNALTDQIEDITGGFSNMASLEQLDLSNNKIGRVSRSVFSSLARLVHLNMNGNPVAEVEPNAFVDTTSVLINSASFLCDCNLVWFTTFIQRHGDNNQARCRHPFQLAEKQLKDIKPSALKCDKNPRPVISSHPKSRSVQDGHEAMFECKAKTTEVESTQIEWQVRREGDLQWLTLTNDPDLYEIKHSRPPSGTLVESMVRLPKVNQDVSGVYRCRVVNNYAKTVSNEAQLTVHKLPAFTTTFKNKTVEVGGRVKFACNAHGHPEPEIQWVRTHSGMWDHGTADDLGKKLELNKKQKTMQIKQVDIEDSGKYTCIAKNSAGFVQHDIFISMAPIPERIMYEPTMTSIRGRNAVLDCAYPVAIYPEVAVTWYYNDREINSTSLRHFLTVNKSQMGVHHLLIINEASDEDDGLYQCRVHNSVGSATGSIDLKIVATSETVGIDETIPIWIWVVTSIISTFLLSSIIWLAIFCRALVLRKRQNQSNGDSDLGTDSTNIPSPMERHLQDNRTYHVNKKLDNRLDEAMKATPVSSIETGDSQTTESTGQPLLNNPYLQYQMGPYHQSPYLSYNPLFPPSPYHPSPHHHHPHHHMVPASPYMHPFYQMQMSPYCMPASPAAMVPETPKQADANKPKGFGPDSDLPYRAPAMPLMAPITMASRALTLPELDNQHRRATFGGAPLFHYNDTGSEAPGPSRRKQRARRSEALTGKRLFERECTSMSHSQAKIDQAGAKIADDDGIVNRLLGPVETTD